MLISREPVNIIPRNITQKVTNKYPYFIYVAFRGTLGNVQKPIQISYINILTYDTIRGRKRVLHNFVILHDHFLHIYISELNYVDEFNAGACRKIIPS